MTIHFSAKDFKETLKSFTKLSRYSSSNLAPISFVFEPSFQIMMVTEHAFIISQPNVSVQPPVSTFSFNPEVLLDLALTDGDVSLYWEDKENSPLHLKNNYLRTQLRVSVPMPEFDDIPETMESIEVPYGLLYAANKFLSIPFIFFTAKKELMPVWFRKNSKGCLEISASDGYSLARINTEIPVKPNLDIKIPKYILECLYSKGDLKDTTPMKFGVYGAKSLFSNKTTQIYSASMNDDVSDFEVVVKDFKSNVSCDFTPKKLSEAIKPLVSILPKKDKSGSILAVRFETDKVSMSTTHKDIGEGTIDFVEGISNIYLEKSAKVLTVNMLPQAFQEYTDLLDLDQASMFADNRMVYYRGVCTVGEALVDIEYVFPTAL